MSLSLLEQVRKSCKEVAKRALYVHINRGKVRSYVKTLMPELNKPPKLDPSYHYIDHTNDTVSYILILDTVNFGSGYANHIRKRVSSSGYLTFALALKERFQTKGAFTAIELAKLTVNDCAGVFGQSLDRGPCNELMGHFAFALNGLGQYLIDNFSGQFVELVNASGSSAELLVRLLASMPSFQDVAVYDGFEVSFYKRAQLVASDLSKAFDNKGHGYFNDIDRLTIFADNAIPHVLRSAGILCYHNTLASRIDKGELIQSGSKEEIEIRAVALHVVELLVEELRIMGQDVIPMKLDYILWNRAHDPFYKTRLRHQTRTLFY